MVVRLRRGGTAVYSCEACGFGYRNVVMAEECEEHCGLRGYASIAIRRKAIYKPRTRAIPVAASQRIHNATLPSSRLQYYDRGGMLRRHGYGSALRHSGNCGSTADSGGEEV